MKKSDALTGIGLLLGIGMMIYNNCRWFFIGSINYSTIRSDEKDW